MLNGTNPTLHSDMALVSTQLKNCYKYLKAGESSDLSMSTSDGVGNIYYTRALENQQGVSHRRG